MFTLWTYTVALLPDMPLLPRFLLTPTDFFLLSGHEPSDYIPPADDEQKQRRYETFRPTRPAALAACGVY